MVTAISSNGRTVRTPTKTKGFGNELRLSIVESEDTTSENKEVLEDELFVWNDDNPLRDNIDAFGRHLAKFPDLFRRVGEGLLLLGADRKPTDILKAADLAPVIADRVRVIILKDGKPKGGSLSASILNTMLRSEVFRSAFLAVDRITTIPEYLPDFRLTKPGYNDGGQGHRVLYVGSVPKISDSMTLINAFLDEMDFESNADRTNAVAAILIVMLHNHWPGGKPILLATATKSHAGKDTVLLFATGVARHTSISYQSTNWALERSFVGALNYDAEVAVVVIENARLDRSDNCIASAFIERFATDPEPLLFSTGTGRPCRRRNDIVLAISTNFGSVSEDIMNRSLPIHLCPVGNVADRVSRIGNPKLEFLPRHREEIAGEVRGMIERWKAAGMPMDDDVRHPFSVCAKTVGGILKVNGYQDFLANYGNRRTVADPIREGLGILGLQWADSNWARPEEWAQRIAILGLTKRLIPKGDQDSEAGRCRGTGVILSAHLGETFVVENEDERLTLLLKKQRKRSNDKVHTTYQFVVKDRTRIVPEIEERQQTSISPQLNNEGGV